MATIPQRELGNNVSDVLRRAESGERFAITLDGRPVAELSPVSGSRRFAAGARLASVLAGTPVDAEWVFDLDRLRHEDDDPARDPWRP